MTSSQRALVERERLARNLDEGFEVETHCLTHGTPEWVRVTDMLDVLGPIPMVLLTVAPVGEPLSCCPFQDRFTVRRDLAIVSRRPASVAVSRG